MLVERVVRLLSKMLHIPKWLRPWLMVSIFLQITLAHPLDLEDWSYGNSTFLADRADTFFLRILPLGGSVTLGWGSSTGNG